MFEPQTKLRLCYILPEYDEKIAGHFYHQYELLRELSKKLDIFLIAENGEGRGVHIQKFRFLPLRFVESFFLILWARIKGYKNFYTHYCYIGGINAGIISRLFGGKSYYWHCEMIWEFKQKILSKIGFNLALKLSHFLITGSEGLKKDYAKHYGLREKNIKVMPNWINLNRFNRRNTQIDLASQDTQKHAEESEFLYSDITYKIRGACFKIWKEFRGAFKEKVIERALAKELQNQGLTVNTQKQISVFYDNETIGKYVPDMVVNDKVLVELKSKTFLTKEDEKQFWLYLKGSKYRLGLLINFGKRLEIKRKVYDTARNNSASISVLPKAQNQRVSARPKVILFVHRLAKRKGAHLLIPIAKKLISDSKFQIPNSKFLIIGDGPLKNKILQEIKENKLEDYVQVLGKVSHEDILKYYAQADIFIMPSLQEGFPHVLLEAMAMGIPYVVSDVGAVREFSPKIAQDFIVTRGEIEEFAQKIKILLSDEEIYNKFRQEELEKVKEYSLDKIIDKFVGLFDK